MKTLDNGNVDTTNSNSASPSQKPADVLLIERNESVNSSLKCKPNFITSLNGIQLQSMGGKSKLQVVCPVNESRSQSMPNSLDNEGADVVDTCDIKSKLLVKVESPPHTPSHEFWFKTWPERCDKEQNKQSPTKLANCKNGLIESKVTLNEALQNISLAYSPITKQLHLLSQANDENRQEDVEECIDIKHEAEETTTKKSGHKRTEAGSFSSTVSSLSDPSPSGSLLDAEERSSTPIDEDYKKRKGFSNFFNRNVFSWKPILFNKPTSISGSPQHCQGIVASSSALIQNIRPSNLPAKTIEEEQRHREEYKAILAAAKKKEAQSTAAKQKQQKMQLLQEEQLAAAAKHFAQNVVPNWENMYGTRKTRDLWWQGLPSSVRGKVWRLAIGNDLNVTQQLYEICLQRAQTRLSSPESCHSESDLDQESSMEVIQLDISRTFPNLCIFQEGGPFSDVLHSLLAAYVCYRPDVGYVQGMSYIAAILILNMEELDAFVCFSNLLNRPLHLAAFTLNQNLMSAYYNAFNEIFSYNLPKLYSHFDKSGLTPDLYLLDWLYTIFARSMPLDVACRVWDLFLRDGDEFIFRTALGVLHLHQDLLLDMDFLHGAQFLTHLPDDLSTDLLFKSIQSMNTSIGKQTFNQIVERYKLAL